MIGIYKIKLIYVFCTVLSFVFGGYLGVRFTSSFFIDTSYSSVVAEQVKLTAISDYLEEGNVAAAIEYIDGHRDHNDFTLKVALNSESKNISKQTETNIRRVLLNDNIEIGDIETYEGTHLFLEFDSLVLNGSDYKVSNINECKGCISYEEIGSIDKVKISKGMLISD